MLVCIKMSEMEIFGKLTVFFVLQPANSRRLNAAELRRERRDGKAAKTPGTAAFITEQRQYVLAQINILLF